MYGRAPKGWVAIAGPFQGYSETNSWINGYKTARKELGLKTGDIISDYWNQQPNFRDGWYAFRKGQVKQKVSIEEVS